MVETILGYVAMMNILGFLIMWIDKEKAKRNRWRIPEATLHSIAWLGGAPGMLLARQQLRHKSRKMIFAISFIAATFIWIGMIVVISVGV